MVAILSMFDSCYHSLGLQGMYRIWNAKPKSCYFRMRAADHIKSLWAFPTVLHMGCSSQK